MTLLVVDSNAATGNAAAGVLREAGFESLETDSAADALRLCASHRLPLVIVAVRGADDANADFCRQLKNNQDFASVFVLQISPESLVSANGAVEDGSYAPDAWLAEPYNPQNLIAIVRTLLKFQQTQSDLLLRKEHYRAFIQQSSEGIWRFEVDEPISTALSPDEQIELFYERGYLAECNDAMARQYGLNSAADLVGIRLADLLVRSDEANYQYLRAFIKSGYRLTEAESHERDANGDDKYFLNNLVGIAENGKLVRAWGTQRDVTARKRAERALRESEARRRLALEAGQMGTWEWNPETRGINTDSRFVKLYGVAPENLNGTDAPFLAAVHPDDTLHFQTSLRTSLAAHAALQVEFRVIHPNGETRWLSCSGRTAYDKNGNPVRVVGVTYDVTERMRADEAVRESEAQYRIITETASDAIISIDENSRIIFINRAAERVFGYKVEEMLNQPLTMLMPADFRSFHHGGLNRYLETGERKLDWDNVEVRGRHRDGHEFPLELSFGESHRSGRHIFIGIARDITERKEIENALRKSQAQLLLSTEAAQIAPWRWNVPTGEVSLSPLHAKLWGIDESELNSKFEDWVMRVHPDDREKAYEAVARARKEKGLYESEYRLIPSDGSAVRWFRSVGRFIYDENEQAVEMYGIDSDITTRRESETALRESQMRLKLTTDAAQIGTWQWNLHTNNIFWSAIHQQMWGYEAADGEIHYEDWRRLIEPEDLVMAENEIEIARRDGSLYDIEYRIAPADGGAARWIRSIGQVIYDETNTATQMLGISTDITRRKATEDEVLRLNQELQKRVGEAELANRSKDEFLAVLSHELRTPLNSMFGWVRMLSTGQLDEEKTSRAIEVIERNIGVQTKLIEDILDVSRIISGKIQLETRQLDFVHLVASVVELTRPTAEAKNVEIVLDFVQEHCKVEGDGERLQQVVGNLLSNAIKFTAAGGTVAIGLDCRNNQVEFSVADTGIGIAPEFLPQVFDRFRQADSTSKRRHGGLGLGLAIVKHLVELHGGAVSASSDGEGMGAIFSVSLPMQKKRQKAVFTSSSANNHEDFKLDGIRLLIVDDDADTLEMMRTMLAAQGANVTAASSGMEALRFVETSAPDLLISDIGMPEMDGIEFIGKLRNSNRISAASLPAIALTAYAGVDDRERILKSGFQRYLPKPISFSELLTTIKSLVKKTETKI